MPHPIRGSSRRSITRRAVVRAVAGVPLAMTDPFLAMAAPFPTREDETMSEPIPEDTPYTIALTRAYARSENTLGVAAVLDEGETDEPFVPDGRFYRYDHDNAPTERWSYDNFRFHIQDIITFQNKDLPTPEGYFVILSSEGEVWHGYWKGAFQEKIAGAGTWTEGAKGYGRLMTIGQIGDRLYACGDGGQIYVRRGRDDWALLTDSLLYDPVVYRMMMKSGPSTSDPGYLDWILGIQKKKPRNILFHDMQALSEKAIYLCGEEGPGTKPVLCFWDGDRLHELDPGITEGALTGLYIESPDSIWICGREGVLLHGNPTTGFAPVPARTRLNLFHMITPYRGTLVLPASVRPGGLYQLDPETGDFGHFEPRLPRLTSRDDPNSIEGGPFFAQGVGDVLWVVAEKDVFRFDGSAWERIPHPDL